MHGVMAPGLQKVFDAALIATSLVVVDVELPVAPNPRQQFNDFMSD